MILSVHSPNLAILAQAIPVFGRQIPFAQSKAINDTLKDVQAWTVKTYLPEVFTLRSKGAPWQRPGTKFGFNIKFANKATLNAALGSKADWLDFQERGGTKTGKGHRVAIATLFWKRREEIMAKPKKPAALIKMMGRLSALHDRVEPELGARGRITTRTVKAAKALKNRVRKKMAAISSLTNTPFLAKGKLHPGIYVRTGKSRLPIKALFSFVQHADVRKRLNFEALAGARAISVYPREFRRALDYALTSAGLKRLRS